MKTKFWEFGKIKTTILVTSIIVIMLIAYLMTKVGILCMTDDDCIGLRCGIECDNLCIRHRCTIVQCKDHGRIDENFKCICNEGWTGRYCEQKISE